MCVERWYDGVGERQSLEGELLWVELEVESEARAGNGLKGLGGDRNGAMDSHGARSKIDGRQRR